MHEIVKQNRAVINSILMEWSLTAGNLIKQKQSIETSDMITVYLLERLLNVIQPLQQTLCDRERKSDINATTVEETVHIDELLDPAVITASVHTQQLDFDGIRLPSWLRQKTPLDSD